MKTLKKWSGAYAVHSAKLQISDTRTGLTSSVAYLTPPADAQAREEFYREVLPHTVSFVMIPGWYEDNRAPFHAFVRIGPDVFRLSPTHGITKEDYSTVLEGLLSRTTGPKVEVREMLFAASEQARKALHEYFTARMLGEVPFRYEVDAVGLETYGPDAVKEENCVTFAISFLERRWAQSFPDILRFQREANFHLPPSDTPMHAQAVVGYLSLTARAEAVVIWGKGAYERVTASEREGKVGDFYRDFIRRLSGRRANVTVSSSAF